MNDDQQKPILVGLGALALLAGAGWLYVLANQPDPEVLPPGPVLVRRIVCDAPTQGLESDAHLRDIEVQGDQLSAVVHSDRGTALWRDTDGIARLQIRWQGAQPGREVGCEATVPARSRIEGQIDGLAEATMLSGCTDGLTEVTAGRFQVETIVEHRCSYWFMDASGEMVGKVDATAHAGAPLVLALR